jgi:hypothetical protein
LTSRRRVFDKPSNAPAHTMRRKDGKVYTYWRLVRSVRVGREVVHQTVAQLRQGVSVYLTVSPTSEALPFYIERSADS